MANNSNKKLVPEAMDALDKFKYEVASEVGVNLKDGYNGDISAREDVYKRQLLLFHLIFLPNVFL